MEDEHFMKVALENAKKAFELNEVPVGAVLVYQEKIIAQGYNQVEMAQDATSHAEINCIREAQQVLHNWRLNDCTLYTTLEPCLMCFGALTLSRVKKIVYGAKDLRHGACGGCFNLIEQAHPIHVIEVVGGVLKDEAALMLKDFFKKVRVNKNDE
jgi:tRNA(adenine34) deaminase